MSLTGCVVGLTLTVTETVVEGTRVCLAVDFCHCTVAVGGDDVGGGGVDLAYVSIPVGIIQRSIRVGSSSSSRIVERDHL